MLKRFGVRGVKVQEVISLDDEMLSLLPSVVPDTLDGIILTWQKIPKSPCLWPHFPFQVDGRRSGQAGAKLPSRDLVRESGNAEEELNTLPISISDEDQTINNACASVALLNIVNNIPEVELGENLDAFKKFTMGFSPALRGDAISHFEFVKEIHNSFARYITSMIPDSIHPLNSYI